MPVDLVGFQHSGQHTHGWRATPVTSSRQSSGGEHVLSFQSASGIAKRLEVWHWLTLRQSFLDAGSHLAPAECSRTPTNSVQALVYDILPSTTAVFSYVIGSRKLSANEQFFVGVSTNSSKFVTNNSNKTRHVIYSRQQSLHQHIICKTTVVWIEIQLFFSLFFSFFFFFFCPGWMRLMFTWVLGLLPQFYQYPNFWRALTAPVNSCAEIKSASSGQASGLTKHHRVWRKMPESDARSVTPTVSDGWAITVQSTNCEGVN